LLKRIGILGGTFNPVHNGHLRLAQDALKRFDLDRVFLIPCARPPHKRPDRLAPARHRLAMLKAVSKGKPRFAVSDIEIKRGGLSYSIDTVRRLKKLHPKAEVYFIIGGDSINELDSWKQIGELQKLCTFIATGRPGFRVKGSPRVIMFKGHAVDVSSSEIRKRIAEGKSIRRLVPAAAGRYIADRCLYQAKESRRSKHLN
jgi:nicotinate-nucleotide adenylyltransferase